MHTPLFDNDLPLLSHLVRSAGDTAALLRTEGLTLEHKSSPSDLVTQADRAAENLVSSLLQKHRPNDTIYGEEGTNHPGTSGTRWTIDPVDGTFNFAHNFEYWCSAIAITHNDPTDPHHLNERRTFLSPSTTVTYGAVYQPCTDTLWIGGHTHPTTRNGVPLLPFGHPARHTPDSLSHACINTYLHPPFYATPSIYEAWNRVITSAATYRMMGSASVDLASVAEGDTDLWIQHRLPDWDRLPGAGLVLGVGGTIVDVAVGTEIWTIAGAPHLVHDAVAALQGD